MANWELTIKDTSTGQYHPLPVLPIDGKLGYLDGNKKTISLNIVDLGEVQIPAGVNLDSMGWKSIFPGAFDANLCNIPRDKIKQPLQYRNQFSTWKDNGTKLVIICPQAGIQKDMFVFSFSWEPVGAFGDLEYNVSFTEWKDIRPVKVTPGGQLASIKVKGPADRDALPAQPKPSTYTVKAGDTLSQIGKQLRIDWRIIYEKNKAVIGSNPGLIKPGQVFKI